MDSGKFWISMFAVFVILTFGVLSVGLNSSKNTDRMVLQAMLDGATAMEANCAFRSPQRAGDSVLCAIELLKRKD